MKIKKSYIGMLQEEEGEEGKKPLLFGDETGVKISF
jgi:hypothetical protein